MIKYEIVKFNNNSVEGIKFRKWASKVLKEYLLTGYVINDERVSIIENNYKPQEFKNSRIFLMENFMMHMH